MQVSKQFSLKFPSYTKPESNLMLSHKAQNQWLFEIPFQGFDAESKTPSHTVRYQSYVLTGQDAVQQKTTLVDIKKDPEGDYEKMIVARFKFKVGQEFIKDAGGKSTSANKKNKKRVSDGTADNIPVEITVSREWWKSSRKKDQLATYLSSEGKVMLVVPFYDQQSIETSKAQLKSIGDKVWHPLPSDKKKKFGKFDIRMIVTKV
jgi:hypothetical protein